MSANAHLVYANFAWRLENATPTSTFLAKQRFQRIDPMRLDPGQGAGLLRAFSVAWLGSGGDEGATDGSSRLAIHTYEVRVYYPTKPRWDDLHALILSDRHDVIKRLRATDYYAGYDDAHPTTSVGLFARIREQDSLEMGDDEWVYRSTWLCHIDEPE